MSNDQDSIDAHISGKIDARERIPVPPEMKAGSGECNFYIRGYNEEKKRMESAGYCRMRGINIIVNGAFAANGSAQF